MPPANGQEVNIVRWLLGIFATLFVAGSVGVMTTNSQVKDSLSEIKIGQAKIATQVEGLIDDKDEQNKELDEARISLRALELLCGRIDSNHTALKAELEDMRLRVRTMEQGGN